MLDTAKALSGLLGSDEPVERFLEGIGGTLEAPGPVVPWIAVPTTAGTGAEVTRNAVLRVKRVGLKRSMRSALLLAAAVIVDPELTVDLPAHRHRHVRTRRTHAARGGARLAQGESVHVVARPREHSCPCWMPWRACVDSPRTSGCGPPPSYGAFVSGIALANAGLGAAHGFAAGVGGMFDIPHGLLCAVFLPHVLEANAAAIRDRVAELAAVGTAAPTPSYGWPTRCAAFSGVTACLPTCRGTACPSTRCRSSWPFGGIEHEG